MLKDGRDALNKLRVEECNTRNSSKVGCTHYLIEFFRRDFVVEFIKVLLSKHTIPNIHDCHQSSSESQREIASLVKLVKDRTQIYQFHGTNGENISDYEKDVSFPYHYHYEY
ncbi:hypothetical protein IC582_017516 [Cucumis melo]